KIGKSVQVWNGPPMDLGAISALPAVLMPASFHFKFYGGKEMSTIGSQNKLIRVIMMNGTNPIFEDVWILAPDVQIPAFHAGELLQLASDVGRFRGDIDVIRHEMTVGSGNIQFVTTVRCRNSSKVP
ncbi:MAG: hypothetical protein ACK5JM_00905, partial [Rhodoblastus sp.]